jgi:hypothetical protein
VARILYIAFTWQEGVVKELFVEELAATLGRLLAPL